MTTDAFFGEVRSLAHALQSDPSRIDHALWCLLTLSDEEEHKPWRAYLREAMEDIRLGHVSLLEVVAWLEKGRPTLRAMVEEKQKEVPDEDRVTQEDLDVFLCVMAWAIATGRGEVMMARQGFFVFFHGGDIQFSNPNGNYSAGIMGDTHFWRGFEAWVKPPSEMSRAARDPHEKE